MRTHIVALIFSAILCLTPYGHGQQNQPADHRALTPEQQAYRQWEAHYRQNGFFQIGITPLEDA